MRITLYSLMLFWSLTLHATEVNIKVIPLDGKPAYVLQVGSFVHEKEAEDLTYKLIKNISLRIHGNVMLMTLQYLIYVKYTTKNQQYMLITKVFTF